MGHWRAGPVAGHGLRLRRLRLRSVSRATRPNTVLARPGWFVHVAVRGRYCPRGRSACAGLARVALRRSVVGTVVCLRLGEPTGAHRLLGRLSRRPGSYRASVFHAGAGASDHSLGAVASPPKQAPAYGASTRSLLVRSRREPPDPATCLRACRYVELRSRIEANSMFSALGVPSGVRELRAQRAHVCGNQPMATATGALVSSNSAGSNRASRRLYSLANAGQIVKFRPSGPTYHE